MQRLFLLSKLRPGLAYEVLSFDKTKHLAQLRGAQGKLTDINFHIEIIKRCYDLTEVEPESLKGAA